MSILKALNPYSTPDLKMNDASNSVNSNAKPTNLCSESTQSEMQAVVQQCQPSLHSPQEPIIKDLKPSNCVEPNVKESSPRVTEIVRGDTLWGLSGKCEVSIEAIKQANGLAGDTIYGGKKLFIP